MRETNRNSAMRWTRERALLLLLVCLAAGAAGGWSIAGLRTEASRVAIPEQPTAAVASQETVVGPALPSQAQSSSSQLKGMADAQAATLVEKLASDPASPGLLTSLGNLYYDAQQYPLAVDYYARALRTKPADADVRTDMGTAFWFMGNADRAIAEFNKALTYVPDNPNTLFNLGLVKWKGNGDAAGATAAWERLLAIHPRYEHKDQVEQMLAEIKSTAAGH